MENNNSKNKANTGNKTNAKPVIKKTVATIKNPTILAINDGLFKFTSESQAVDRMNNIRNNFIISRSQDLKEHLVDEKLRSFNLENVEITEEIANYWHTWKSAKAIIVKDQNGKFNITIKESEVEEFTAESKSHEIILWVKGYGLTKEEEEEGFLGNFGRIYIKKTEEGKFTLLLEKIEKPIRLHPQKKRNRHKHPNWAHHVLRKIKKGHVYTIPTEATEDLEILHEEFPDISIPAKGKLFIMVYKKPENEGDIPVEKIVLEQKLMQDGTVIIEWKANERKKLESAYIEEKNKQKEEVKKEEPQGYFTSMVSLKRNKFGKK